MRFNIDARPRALRLAGIAVAVMLALALPGRAGARVETETRFLEFDARAGILAYEMTVRNLGSLPVSFVELSAEPACVEGPLATTDLAKEERVTRRFTFRMAEGKLVFHPRFTLAYTDHEGERHRIETGQSPLVANIDFESVDLATGEVVLQLDLSNPGRESLLFLELWSENPALPDGRIAIGDLAPGERIVRAVDYRFPPGERLFNPTLHVSFHAFETEGTRYHRKFFTVLQPRLDRVEAALNTRDTR